MKNLKILTFITLLALIIGSCDEVLKNSDANLLEISFHGQIGVADADPLNSQFTSTIFADDFSNIKISKMIISENASSSVKVGESLNFNNATSSATIIITSETGFQKTYTIFADQFGVPAFIGNWTLTTDCYFNYTYCDDLGENCGQDYYGTLSSDDYGDYFINGAKIYDNTLKMEYTSMDESGYLTGTYNFGPGVDGKMGSFEHQPATGAELDLNDNFLRLFPGDGTWKWNSVTNEITFFNSDKTKQSVTYSNMDDKTHWKVENDPNQLTLWFTVNRNGLPTDHEAFLQYGYTATAWTLAGYVISLNMVRN